MNFDQLMIFIALIIGFIFWLIKVLEFIEKDAKETWWVVAEGTYVDSIAHNLSSKEASKMTGYYAPLPPLVFNTITLETEEKIERIKVLNVSELPPIGTKIRVIKNKRADFKIEKIETA